MKGNAVQLMAAVAVISFHAPLIFDHMKETNYDKVTEIKYEGTFLRWRVSLWKPSSKTGGNTSRCLWCIHHSVITRYENEDWLKMVLDFIFW